MSSISDSIYIVAIHSNHDSNEFEVRKSVKWPITFFSIHCSIFSFVSYSSLFSFFKNKRKRKFKGKERRLSNNLSQKR